MSASPASPPTTATAGGRSNNNTDQQEDLKRHQCSSFLAGDEDVDFIPSFTHERMELMCRTSVGPFYAGLDVTVPLWLAVLLRQRNMGRIVPPSWMDVVLLKRVLRHERDTDTFSKELPFRYQEMARSILAVESHDLDHAAEIRLLLQDIGTVRMDKIKSNLHTLSKHSLSQPTTLPMIDVTNMGSTEMSAFRPFILQAFRNHLTLTRSANRKKTAEDARSAGLRASTKHNQQELDDDDDSDDESDATPRREEPVKSRIRRFR